MPDAKDGEAQVISVVVADDQTIVREGLTTVLSLLPDIEVVGEARDGAEAVELVTRLAPDVALMDLRMPVLDGVAATAAIAAACPGTAVLVLTTYADDESIAGALRAGARGYLTKDAGRHEIATAIRAVAGGQATFSAEVGQRLVAALTTAPQLPTPTELGLSARELDVLRLMAKGCNNSEIAKELFIGVSTVKSHVNSLFAKLRVRDRAQAIAQAHRMGLGPSGT
ncbi:response regulator transcription factor [Nocardia arthritidis]|uniref:Response regulator n=1 Tax=Nocardia arthritidis TaxID=228602 RepID=A0A6G9YUG4_9NOCA|nr:response regulator transcription factor [Nocardia arthritidis]QIS16741.1 response regulator [Nocardia arthritidis]